MDDLLSDIFLPFPNTAKRLEELGFESRGIESEASILNLEGLIGVRLPEGYRNFMLKRGGGYFDNCVAKCRIPTPFGEHVIIELVTVEDILTTLICETIPRNLLCIGKGNPGQFTCISIAGIDHGSIYAFDSDMRFYWTAEKIDSLPVIDPSIKEFFALRDSERLPYRAWGYENCYDVAGSFDEFLHKLERFTSERL